MPTPPFSKNVSILRLTASHTNSSVYWWNAGSYQTNNHIVLFPNLTDALKSGLLSKVVPEEKLEEEVNAIATKIVSLSQPVVAMGKSCFYSQTMRGRDQAYVWVLAKNDRNLLKISRENVVLG